MSNLLTKTIDKRINDDGTITIQYKELDKEITYPKRNYCFDKIIASILNNHKTAYSSIHSNIYRNLLYMIRQTPFRNMTKILKVTQRWAFEDFAELPNSFNLFQVLF